MRLTSIKNKTLHGLLALKKNLRHSQTLRAAWPFFAVSLFNYFKFGVFVF